MRGRAVTRYAYSWQAEGEYNWKTLMDGYQECYHCTFVTFYSLHFHVSSYSMLVWVIQALRRHVLIPILLFKVITLTHLQTLDLNSYRVTPLQNAARHEVSNKEDSPEEYPPVSDVGYTRASRCTEASNIMIDFHLRVSNVCRIALNASTMY